MRRVVIILAFLMLFVSAVQADWSGATADRHISYFSSGYQMARFPRIVAGPEGNLYCVWRQGQTLQSYELYFGRSTDNGVTWSSETIDVMISADDGQNVASVGDKPFGMATDSQGNIFIVWAEDLHEIPEVQEIMLLKSTDQGQTWIHSNSDFNISFDGAPDNDAFDPDIAVDNNDDIYVVWHQRPVSDTSEIHISISTDAGDTWSGTGADRYISYRSGHIASNPHIAVAPNNDIYVVWDEKTDPDDITSYKILYGKSTDAGATFNSETADQPTSTAIRSSGDAYMVIDPSGNIHVTWQATRATASPFLYEIFYTGSTDGGATWSGLAGPQLVDFGADDGSSAWNQALAVNSNGDLIAVWNETPINFDDAEAWAGYSTDGGLTWSGNNEPELISFPDGHGAYNPDIAVGAGDTLFVVWNEGVASSGYYDIHLSIGDTLAGGTTDIREQVVLPGQVALHQNHPNPFNATTAIEFTLSEPQSVTLTVYDLLGKVVCLLLEEERPAGIHRITFDAADLPSGIYFYRLKGEDRAENRRMLLLK
ncbi:MAG: exo-alpha-sialidase [Candidatus Zixiibacteriota bacterium]|nr:MAG: exo-alpha-sialidase [candidate division Zixibacteria bacterium]